MALAPDTAWRIDLSCVTPIPGRQRPRIGIAPSDDIYEALARTAIGAPARPTGVPLGGGGYVVSPNLTSGTLMGRVLSSPNWRE